MPFDAVPADAIFEPLGMKDTAFSVPARKRRPLRRQLQRGPDKTVAPRATTRATALPETATVLLGRRRAGTTAPTTCASARCWSNGGELDGVPDPGPQTIELMTCNHLPDGEDLTQLALGSFSETANEGDGFGLGFSINLGPGRTATLGRRRLLLGRRGLDDLLGRSEGGTGR